MTITFPMIAWAVGLFLIWNGFLVGIIKFFITREIKGFETRLDATDKKAGDASEAASKAKEAVTSEVAAVRLEFSQKLTCGNHQRMESNDVRLFKRFDDLHGDIRELTGGVKGLTQSLAMINDHLLNGGK